AWSWVSSTSSASRSATSASASGSKISGGLIRKPSVTCCSSPRPTRETMTERPFALIAGTLLSRQISHQPTCGRLEGHFPVPHGAPETVVSERTTMSPCRQDVSCTTVRGGIGRVENDPPRHRVGYITSPRQVSRISAFVNDFDTLRTNFDL